ncbi:5-carboxymethyl-2-hydroxymuconate isomerase [Variovorax boronicumulans]|uniref:5-carboxymethyl-2-hydroxymuconate Delta-isomerase n=1 Tax=Variovorax boronicumulans TaxID=436515 RepID=UPI002788D7B8|nr:hypothetical protein [Variovorax boronicumulans]MDP9917467.1 5-carboxymethyl-2-hydroxymuconate isomerase [Variovorax boronicumulans]
MPHIAIEVSSSLFAAIEWEPVLHAMHLALAARDWAELGDLKSRVTPIAVELCGADPQAQQLIATLTLTNPRPPKTCAAMAQMVLDHLSRVVGERPETSAWVQCCVFLREHPKSHYLKRQWHAPLSSAP